MYRVVLLGVLLLGGGEGGHHRRRGGRRGGCGGAADAEARLAAAAAAAAVCRGPGAEGAREAYGRDAYRLLVPLANFTEERLQVRVRGRVLSLRHDDTLLLKVLPEPVSAEGARWAAAAGGVAVAAPYRARWDADAPLRCDDGRRPPHAHRPHDHTHDHSHDHTHDEMHDETRVVPRADASDTLFHVELNNN